ncbi:MAG: hypothetical protein M1814_005645 [Vezdaea aestivalis]|nr:MAG: hypothetical protein M1814_005645 [Vezdaea aestivalis]
MKTFEEAMDRWGMITKDYANLDTMKSFETSGSTKTPATRTLRSICWKAYLLFSQKGDYPFWTKSRDGARAMYADLKKRSMRLVDHPEELHAVDPLGDDPKSPWITVRKDEALRAEIKQDVERCLQDIEWFRRPSTQSTLLDILFVFCKNFPGVGYRQGMHELLAPLLWVVANDAIELSTIDKEFADDDRVKALDLDFIEHDSYLLFAKVMEGAQSSYMQTNKATNTAPSDSRSDSDPQDDDSPIIKRSKYIHKNLLRKIDPPLAEHLDYIGVLPQIFLIRWIRLLFGREFAFNEHLGLLDSLFAQGLTDELVDMVCVVMLLRIHWDLLKSDYGEALTTILSYPEKAQERNSNPKRLLHDALWLQEEFTIDRASQIVKQSTGTGFEEVGRRPYIYRAVRATGLPMPNRYDAPNRNVERMVQDAAKGVLSQAEKWGLNKAVRDAVGEVRRSLLFPPTPSPLPASGQMMAHSPYGEAKDTFDFNAKQFQKFQKQKNKHMAEILDSACQDLQKAVEDSVHGKKPTAPLKLRASVEAALVKLDFVRLSLEEPTTESDFYAEPLEIGPSQFTQKLDGSVTPARKLERKLPKPVTPTSQNPASPTKPLVDSPSKTTTGTISKSSLAWMLGDDEPSGHGIPSPGLVDKSFSPPSKSTTRNRASERAAFLFGDTAEDERKDGKDQEGSESIGMGPL